MKFKEIITSLALIVLVIASFDPLGWYYSNMTIFTVSAFILVLFVAFQVLIWKNNPRDEREEDHERKSGKVAYFLGTAVLLLGLLVQFAAHDVDVWLVAALIVMILSKMISAIYNDLVN